MKELTTNGTEQITLITRLFLIFCIAIIPFLNFYSLIDPAHFSKFTSLGFGLVIFLVLLFFSFYKKPVVQFKTSVFSNIIFPVYLLFLLISGLSTITAINTSEAVFDFLKNCTFFSFFVIATLLIANSKKDIDFLMKLTVLFTIAIVLIGLAQLAKVATTESLTDSTTTKVYAVFMNKNLFSQILFLALPFNVYAVLSLKKIWNKIAWFNVVTMLFLIVVLITRSVWLAIIISSVVTIVTAYITSRKKHKIQQIINWRLLIIIFSTIVFAISIIALTGGLRSEKGIINKLSVEKGLENPRFVLWEKSLNMAIDHPWLGVGGGNWKINISDYGVYDEIKIKGKKRFNRAHNDYLWIASENGFIGFAAYVCIILIALFYLLKLIIHDATLEEKRFSFVLLFGFVGYLVFSFFSYPKERIELNIFLLLYLALIVTGYHRLNRGKEKSMNIKKLYMFGMPLIFLLLFSCFAGYKKLSGEFHTKKAIEMLNIGNNTRVIDEIDRGYSWFYGLDPTATPIKWYSGLANFRLNNLKAAFNDFRLALSDNPFHSHTYNSLGIIKARESNFAEAEKYFKKALSLRPHATETLLNLSNIYLLNNEYQEAWIYLNKIDPYENSNRFKRLVVTALEHEIDLISNTVNDEWLRKQINILKSSKPTTLSVYQQAMDKNEPFNKEYLHYLAVSLLRNNNNLSEQQNELLQSYLKSD